MKKGRKIWAIMLMIFLFSHSAYAETYEYDALDRVTKVTYEDGSSVTYEYDAGGNMISTQVTEPEQEESLGTWIEEVWDTVEPQITEAVEELLQEVQTIITNLFGWLFG